MISNILIQDIKISIGIPTYNRPKLLKKAVESVLNQTYKNIEVIISDNCSTDKDVSSVLEGFIKDNRVKVYRQKKNEGFIFNMNFVLEASTGEYFMRLNDDDWIDPNYLELCMKVILTQEDSIIGAYGPAVISDTIGNAIEKENGIEFNGKVTCKLRKYFNNVVYNSQYYSLVKSNVAKKCLVLNNSLGTDWAAVGKLLIIGDIVCVKANSHILIQGESSNVSQMAKNMGLGKFQQACPYTSAALSTSINLYKFNIQMTRSFLQSLLLCFRVFRIIFFRFKGYSELVRYAKGILTIR